MPRKKEDKMVLVNAYIPKEMLEELDRLVAEGVYPSRSEAVRRAIGELLAAAKGRKSSDDVYPNDAFIIGR